MISGVEIECLVPLERRQMVISRRPVGVCLVLNHGGGSDANCEVGTVSPGF